MTEVSPPWGVSEGLKRALTREVDIPLVRKARPKPDGEGDHWRDKDSVRVELAKAIYYTHPVRTYKPATVWENLSQEMQDWVLAQADSALRYLEDKQLLQIELVRLR